MGHTEVKQILCLANSRKYGGRCIVGKERLPDGTLAWVRPVSATERGEVMPDEICYADESIPQLLDVIEVPLAEPRPLPYQPENWLMAPEPWTKTRVADKANIDRWIDPDAPLWENGHESARGTNDRFPYDPKRTLPCSARFISVPALEISVTERKDDSGKINRQLRGSFAYAGDIYDLRITDMDFEEQYAARAAGKYWHAKCYLTVTIGEPFQARPDEPLFNYKLIAAIIEA